VGDLPNDGTHADGWLAGVMRGGNGGIFQTHEQGGLDLGLAFLPPPAVGVGRRERETAADTPLQITPVLIQGGGGSGGTTLRDGKSAPAHRRHPRRTHRIPRLEGTRTIPPLMGQPDWPWRSRVLLWRTREIGHPDGRAMVAQDFVDDLVASAGANHRHTDRGMLNDPGPWGASVHPCAGFITADQPATPQACQDLRHPVVQTRVHPPEELRQGACADGHPIHLGKERRPARVTDGMGLPQRGGQTLD
jgi:hypothetical protein